MAWTAPKTWDETVVTAAMLNTYIFGMNSWLLTNMLIRVYQEMDLVI